MKVSILTRLGVAGALLLSATACEKELLDQVNPNQPLVSLSWQTGDDAVRGATACYAGLQGVGMYRRWLNFAFDLRDDIGFSQSPWGELRDFTRFIQNNYDFEVSSVMWRDHYRTIFRCNQVLDRVPTIQMDAALQKRVLAEAKFLRALSYFNLASLYGNVPLSLTYSVELNPTIPQATEAQVWAQVIKDLQEAAPDLPVRYSAADVGRATQGAAQALLGKAYMQNKRWADAQTQFALVIGSGNYQLTNAYIDNFRHTSENNSESIFEVQFSDVTQGGNDSGNGPDATSSQGSQRSQFWGVPGYGYNDGEVRPWVVREFLQEATATGQRDPRLAATVFYNRLDTKQFPTALPIDSDTLAYGAGFLSRYHSNTGDPQGTEALRLRSRVYWRKYQTDYYRQFENFDSPINQRVIRYADVLLLQAEALNELGRTADAVALINQVRQRPSVNLVPLSPAAYTTETLRTRLIHERATELAGEGVRWFDLQRWGLLDDAAKLAPVKARDDDFNNFVIGKSHLLPLPQVDVDLLRLKQNTGY